jgi:hypothetical protein
MALLPLSVARVENGLEWRVTPIAPAAPSDRQQPSANQVRETGRKIERGVADSATPLA